jgi:RNA polymerase sigma factor (sigma-70 family)
VRNIALEHLRRAKIVPMDALAELTPAIEIDDRPTTEAIVWSRLELDRLIEGLPPRCQSVFRLCYVKGMTQKEAARELRVSENVVQKQLTRAMAQVVKGYARGSEPERTGADG